MIIYLVELDDYDHSDFIGYFTDEEKAQYCCDYLNLTRPSEYPECTWRVKHYRENTMDYDTLLEGEWKRRKEETQRMMDEVEAKEFELYKQLKAKFGDRE